MSRSSGYVGRTDQQDDGESSQQICQWITIVCPLTLYLMYHVLWYVS